MFCYHWPNSSLILPLFIPVTYGVSSVEYAPFSPSHQQQQQQWLVDFVRSGGAVAIAVVLEVVGNWLEQISTIDLNFHF